MNDYLIAGLHIRSDICLSDTRNDFDEGKIPDVIIRDRCQDCDLANFLELSPVLRVGPHGMTRLEIPSIASLLILGGRFVGVVRQPGSSDDDIRCLLLGPGLGIISIQRGTMPVTAACIRVGEAAIALIGPSAAGKSSLAIGLAQRGYEVLSDDVGILEIVDGVPSVLPTIGQIKVWEVTLEELNIPYFDLTATRKLQRRYFYKPATQGNTTKGPIPLKKIYFVEKNGHSTIKPLSREDAAARIFRAVKHLLLVGCFGLIDSITAQALQIASAVPSNRFARNLSSPIFSDVAMLEDDIIK